MSSEKSFFLQNPSAFAWRHVEFVPHELFDIYFNVIHHFRMIFNGEIICEGVCVFEGFVND